MDELFIGSAVVEVTDGGEIMLPFTFHETARSRSHDGRMMIGLHEEARCLVAQDRSFAALQYHEAERRRSSFLGNSQEAHYARQRRQFALAELVTLEPDGMMTLPPFMRERGGITGSALLVATGERFEIWDLDFVLERGPSDLTTLATLHLKQQISNGETHALSLPSPGASRRAARRPQSGVRLQQMPPVRPRHDPVDRTAGIE